MYRISAIPLPHSRPQSHPAAHHIPHACRAHHSAAHHISLAAHPHISRCAPPSCPLPCPSALLAMLFIQLTVPIIQLRAPTLPLSIPFPPLCALTVPPSIPSVPLLAPNLSVVMISVPLHTPTIPVGVPHTPLRTPSLTPAVPTTPLRTSLILFPRFIFTNSGHDIIIANTDIHISRPDFPTKQLSTSPETREKTKKVAITCEKGTFQLPFRTLSPLFCHFSRCQTYRSYPVSPSFDHCKLLASCQTWLS